MLAYHKWGCHRVPCGPPHPAWSTRGPHVCSQDCGSMSVLRSALGSGRPGSCDCEDTGSSTADTDGPTWSYWLSLCNRRHCCCNTCDLEGQEGGVDELMPPRCQLPRQRSSDTAVLECWWTNRQHTLQVTPTSSSEDKKTQMNKAPLKPQSISQYRKPISKYSTNFWFFCKFHQGSQG